MITYHMSCLKYLRRSKNMICYVILHYIVVNETKACVESIKNIDGDKKIIIVDNASPNGSINDLYNLYANDNIVDIVESPLNLGYARGNNLGYEYAISKYHPDFVVVMNNDMEIKQTDFNIKIYKAYNEYNFSILGPDIYSTQKQYHQNPQVRKVLDKDDLKKEYLKLRFKYIFRFIVYLKWTIKSITKKGNGQNDSYSNRKYINEVVINPLLHGSCYIFSKQFIEAHPNKCFYDKTFMYYEAEILYYQAMRDGEKMIYYPDLKVDHHEDKSTDAGLKNQAKKSVFSIKCLMDSSKAFINLMERDGM